MSGYSVRRQNLLHPALLPAVCRRTTGSPRVSEGSSQVVTVLIGVT
jgi:hypothetical protein